MGPVARSPPLDLQQFNVYRQTPKQNFTQATALSELRKVLFWRFCLCMKYLENRRTDLRKIRTEDLFGPSLGGV